MPTAKYMAVASKDFPIVFISKGVRHAEFLTRTMNRVCKLAYEEESYSYQCETVEKYFSTHRILKKNLKFCGEFSYLEKIKLLKIIFKTRRSCE